MFQITSSCYARSLTEEDESVVSVYTTLPTTIKTSKPLDVYQQIATNIGERITSPIYRFLGIGKNISESTTKRTWETVELLDETSVEEEEPMDNNIDTGRDVEELSVEALNKSTKKPEKIVLYSSNSPENNKKLSDNNTNEIDSTFDDEPIEFDDDKEKSRQNGFIKFLTLVGSLVQLAWGTFTSLFISSKI